MRRDVSVAESEDNARRAARSSTWVSAAAAAAENHQPAETRADRKLLADSDPHRLET